MVDRVEAQVQDIESFLAVAKTGSFTRAAEDLGTSKSNVGKAVQRLEIRLGTRLFQRTTRAVRLTEDGETYMLAAQAALEGLREAEQALAARRAEPIGRVRLDVPAGFGRLLLPFLAALRRRHPKVTLDMALTDRMSDPVAEGWDIVVRIGELPADGDMTVRKLCDLRLGLYASPEYIQRKGAIHTVADLSHHDAVIFRGPTGRHRPWTVSDNGHVRDIVMEPVLVLADGQALVDAAISGFGIAQIFDRVAKPHLLAGRLIHILPASDVDGPPVHAIIPVGRRMPAKTRAVLNHLADSLRDEATQG